MISFVLIIDQIRAIFFFRVSVIRLRVLNFSTAYIKNDKNFIRFHLLLVTFILRIYFLILSPNLIRILLGWDGLGLRSYLLVIYYGRAKAYNSGIITVLTNRLGDSLILVSIGYLVIMGEWRLFYYRVKEFNLLVLILLVLAACTKSAQIPFSAWLPAAIAAPTPVSSLVHSSTLVTAGVYLLIRHNELFLINNILYYMLVIGTLTITIASVRALFETDLKKIVALSTLRQLGVIFLSLGLGRFLIRYFHLLTHAFFKALLFLCTGAVIHRSKDYQDLRLTGNSLTSLPTINRFILIARFSLIGLPFISAFFSKEIILETILLKNFNLIIYLFIIAGIRITVLYRTRFILSVYSTWSLNEVLIFKSEEDWFVIKRILILIIPASLRGCWVYTYLFNCLKLSLSLFYLKFWILLLIFLRILLIKNLQAYKFKWKFYLWGLRNIWLLPLISTQAIIYFIFYKRLFIFKYVDQGVIKFNSKYFQVLNSIEYLRVSLKFIHKILLSVFIWLIFFYLFYLCKCVLYKSNGYNPH